MVIFEPERFPWQLSPVDRTKTKSDQGRDIFKTSDSITLLQNYYPGWTAYLNGKKLNIQANDNPGMTVTSQQESGIIEFRYERKPIWISAMILHILIVCFFVWKIYDLIRKMMPSAREALIINSYFHFPG